MKLLSTACSLNENRHTVQPRAVKDIDLNHDDLQSDKIIKRPSSLWEELSSSKGKLQQLYF